LKRRYDYRAICSRCERPDQNIARRMPEGPLCAACEAKAFRQTGRCAGCGQERLLPGINLKWQPICPTCAGLDDDLHCSRCGTEWRLRHGLCEWCYLSDQLDQILAGPVDLGALRSRLLEAPRPDRIIIWLYDQRVCQLLQDLSTGRAEVTHDALDRMTPRRAVTHLRQLLVSVGLIERRDEHVARFDRITAERINGQAPHHKEVLTRFARWRLRPHLSQAASRAPLRAGQVSNAVQKLRVAASFLDWLDERNVTLAGLDQFSVDTWFATPPTTRRSVATFLKWAIRSGQCPRRLKVPKDVRGDGRVLAQADRLALLSKLLDPNTGRLEHRAAGIVLVLLGQPYTRISTMTVDDISVAGEDVAVRLPGGTVPLPHPFGAVFTELVANRPNMNTATNHGSRWLFPGRRADQPMTPNALRQAGIKLGIDLTPAKRSALRQLVLDAPAPVVAEMLGYSYQTVDRHAQQAGSVYLRYATR
jgi:hypothetical protein